MIRTFDGIDELVANPSKYGVPTMEEVTRRHYSKRDQMFGREDDMLISIDNGDPMLRCRQKYFIEHYPVKSLEQAQRIAGEMGLRFPHDFVIDPQLRNDDRGSFYNEVTFRSRMSIERRKRW